MIYEPMDVMRRYRHAVASYDTEFTNLLHVFWQWSIRFEFWHECNASRKTINE